MFDHQKMFNSEHLTIAEHQNLFGKCCSKREGATQLCLQSQTLCYIHETSMSPLWNIGTEKTENA